MMGWEHLKERIASLLQEVGHSEGEYRKVLLEIQEQLKDLHRWKVRSEAYMRTAENSNQALLISEPEGTILEVNPAAARMFGYALEEFRGMPRENIIDTESNLFKTLYKEREKMGFAGGEIWGIRKSGERFPMYFTSVLFNDPDTGKIYAHTTLQDLSEMRKLEHFLMETNRAARVGSWEVDLDTKQVHWTPVTKEIHEVDPDFEPDLQTAILFFKEGHSRDTIQKMVERAIRTGESYQADLEIVTARGNVIWTRAIGQTVFQNGKCLRLYGTFQDIQKNKLVELALERQSQEYQSLLDHHPDALFRLTPDGTILYVNDVVQTIVGLQGEEILGRNFSDFARPEEVDFLKERFEKVNQGKAQSYEATMVSGTGRELRMQVTSIPIFVDGQLVSIFGIGQDITETYRYKQDLENQSRLLTAYFNSTLEGIVLLSADMKLIGFNRVIEERAERDIGRKPQLGDHVLSYIPPELIPAFQNSFNRALTGERLEVERHLDIGERKRIYRILYVPVFNQTGKASGVSFVMSDITETVHARKNSERLRLMYEDLAKNVPGVVYRLHYRPDGTCYFTYLSEKINEIFGLNPGTDLNTWQLSDQIPESEREAFKESQSKALQEQKGWNYEGRIICGDGSLKWFQARSEITGLENEMVYNGILLDIHDRKMAEMDLIVSNERFRFATMATSDALWDWDHVRNTMYRGEGFSALFGYPSGFYTESEYRRGGYIHPEDVDRVMHSVDSAIREGRYRWTEEYRYLKSNGQYATVLDKAVIIKDQSGKTIRIIGAMQDITRQKEEEQRLRLLESVITNADDSVLITEAEPMDLPGPRILYVNDAFTRMTGYTKEEVMGKSPRILQGPKTDAAELTRLGQAMRRWESCEVEVINYRKNGEEFWNNFSVVPVADEKGWYTHWVAIERDTTTRRKREEYERLLYDIRDVLTKEDNLQGGFREACRIISEKLGFLYAEFWTLNLDRTKLILTSAWKKETGPYFVEVGTSMDINNNPDLMATAFSKEKPVFWEDITESPCPTKQMAVASGLKSVMAIPVYFNREVVAMFSFFTENGFNRNQKDPEFLDHVMNQLGGEIVRKHAEEELREFFALSPDLLAIAGFDRRLKKVNSAFTQLSGYSEEELRNLPLEVLVYPEDTELVEELLRHLILGKDLEYIEVRLISRTGQVHWLACTVSVMKEKQLIYCNAKVINEKKQMDEERRKLVDELTKTNAELKQFSYITSHNMRAPLTNLLAISELLDARKIEDEVTQQLIEGFKKSTHSLNETLNDLIRILVIRESKNINKEEIRFTEIFDAVQGSLQSLISRAGALIRTDFSKAPVVSFVPAYLESIFLNFLTNSIKYAMPGRRPEIVVKSWESPDYIIMEFGDNGLGMNMDKVKDRIFGLYQRFHNHPDSKGIGLYLVDSQVRALDGKIEVESLPEQGTTFRIYFKK